MSLVQSFTHLKGRPKSDQALPLLQRIASLVKPIMRKHSWTLPVLAEFFPDSNNLVGLNVNGGQKILLRLRPAWAPDTFYEEEQLAAVMLHELTHNVHGPHNSAFYAFLSTLETEYEVLKRSGYAGEGFHSVGHRVGAGVAHDLPPHLAKAKALRAAEQRRHMANVLGGGGCLGGARVKGLSARELAAQAAERRARDEKFCGSGAPDAQREAAHAAEQSVEDKVIDLTQDDEVDTDMALLDSNMPASGPSTATTVTNTTSHSCIPSTRPVTAKRPIHLAARASDASSNPTRALSQWACLICTLLNPPLAPQCAACLSRRPSHIAPEPKQQADAGWTCAVCGETGIPHDFWTCQFCGEVKQNSSVIIYA